ncbi:uncharacterized protein DNG_01839 [Cephalotrichum gorgonifer]|uniref:Uncharacterized protein n=1 Tax=Cephalotrichum gorgonifer TaxID=2041049 RepID=A0AAE8SS59_9PEZI|nr:uncharacterized protein DNG_01839 [Cephalotrichum gorgonifer]
MASGELAE